MNTLQKSWGEDSKVAIKTSINTYLSIAKMKETKIRKTWDIICNIYLQTGFTVVPNIPPRKLFELKKIIIILLKMSFSRRLRQKAPARDVMYNKSHFLVRESIKIYITFKNFVVLYICSSVKTFRGFSEMDSTWCRDSIVDLLYFKDFRTRHAENCY